MSLENIKTKIAADAPVLSALLGGAMSATALEALGRSVAGDAEATADEVDKALDGATGQTAKVQSAETELLNALAQAAPAPEAVEDFGKRLDTLVSLEQTAAKDREGARVRQLQAKDWWTNPLLAILVTLGFFGVIAHALTTPTSNPLAQTLLGVLGTAWISIIGFYFGSSVGSKEKTAILASEHAANAGPSSTIGPR
ncbi:hypothetical protein [Caulobacter soli]|uniref:hypothetical protein n=1 Tax=Caulobacter soli TaxID=2708539 RepID=UPI0013EAF0AD|nr:hypothetical protein [Caulobacter soli]